jgi:nucleotidyltransferase substrate binding protein (TIGR01987 family)
MEKLNLSLLKGMIEWLEDGLLQASSKPGNDLYRDGVIKRFVCTMDSCLETIERYLRTIVQVDERNIRTKKDLFREAAEFKLIGDAKAWIGHHEARNKSFYGYEQVTAKLVFQRVIVFLPDAKLLLESLRHAA